MKCHEARKLIAPYLDSELDTKTSLEVAEHLGACGECSRFFAAEEKLDERIQSALRQGGRTPSLWAQTEARIEASAPRRSLRRRMWRLAGAFAAAAVVVAGIIAFLPREKGAPDWAAVAEERHHDYAGKKVAPEFSGEIPESVAQKFGSRLDARAFAFAVAEADFSVRGARVCEIGGVPGAWMLGNYKGTPVSLMVFKQSEASAFGELQKRFQSGEPLVDCGRGHCEIVVRIVNGHVVCLVANLPKPLMQRLVSSVQSSPLPAASADSEGSVMTMNFRIN